MDITPSYLVGHNDLILRKVFSFLNLNDLKTCRLVNVNWSKNCQFHWKNKAVIELHFDPKEIKLNTPKKFLDVFEGLVLKNKFSGARIIFESFNTIFDWIGAEKQNPPLIHFVRLYGPQLTYFEMKVVNGTYISYQLVALKKTLVDFMPNLEYLRIYLQTMNNGCRNAGRSHAISNTPSPDSLKLNKLTKFEWMTTLGHWLDDRNYSVFGQMENFRRICVPALTDVISHSPNLHSITTDGSPLTLDVFRKLNSDRVSGIKEIVVDPDQGSHPLHYLLIQLTNLGNENLRLESFTVKLMRNDGYRESLWKLFFVSLSDFITTQKDSLKKLNISIQPGNPMVDPRNIPEFPKLPKVEQLQLSCRNEEMFEALFGGFKNWPNLFPMLKRLEVTRYISYVIENAHDLLPDMITEFNGTHNGIQSVKLFLNNLSTNIDVVNCSEMDDTVKQKFPTLKTLELYGSEGEILFAHSASDQNPLEIY